MYKVAIRKNETGEIRVVEHESEWEDHHIFLWTEGNYGCDCNREGFFTHGEEWPEECSEGRYSALYAELEDGTRITIDEEQNERQTEGCS